MFSSVLGHIKGFISNESKCDTKEDNTKKSCNMSSNLEDDELKITIFELLRTIRDPEKPATLEALNVVFEDGITVSKSVDDCLHLVTVEFHPTVSHCSLATLIGLCIRVKLRRNLLENYKLDVCLKKGTHNTEDEVNKQINDKERVAAAMENQSLRELVELCIKEEE